MPPAIPSTFASSTWEELLALAGTEPASSPSPSLGGRRVLITGAAGSIGSALAHVVIASSPASLLLLDASENGIFELAGTLGQAGSDAALLVGSVCDRPALARLFKDHRPQIVFHAAAYKHVPLMERNPFAAVANNALGSQTLAEVAVEHGAEALILVSTDKAADPASIMGASKRIAELAWLAVARAAGTRAAAVRLANVLGSRGSVLPVFLDQLNRAIPLTVTHPDAERYFMTRASAVEALISALPDQGSALPDQGSALPDQGSAFADRGSAFPDPGSALADQGHPVILAPPLGPPLRILDLAQHLIARHGSGTYTLTGMRAGDKLHEVLLAEDEHWFLSANPGGLRAIRGPMPGSAALEPRMAALQSAVEHSTLQDLLTAVQALVPGYQPSSLLSNSIIMEALEPASTNAEAPR